MSSVSLTGKPSDMRGLRRDLLNADEHKLREVIAVLDHAAAPEANQAILDPVRGRLRALNLARPMRFARLLFLPLDPLIVPARQWNLDQPAVPRTVLMPLARLVRDRVGRLVVEAERLVAADEIAQAGQMLWPGAGAVLASAIAPADWTEATGLPVQAFSPLARAIAAVLRRAPSVWRIMREVEAGGSQPNKAVIGEILAGLADETELGRAMIVRLILARAPYAALELRRAAGAGGGPESLAMLTRAMGRGIDEVLSQIEADDGIGHAGPAVLAREVLGMMTLMRDIEEEAAFQKHRPKLNAIRAKLDIACRARFAEDLQSGLIAPLAEAPAPIDSAAQTRLETQVRGLRMLESVARTLGGAAGYDARLRQAEKTVRDAAAAGKLTPVRQFRLIEIISGADAAEALYNARPRNISGGERAAPVRPAHPAGPHPGSSG